ncbi:unnamed protein product [Camellia sinensis]
MMKAGELGLVPFLTLAQFVNDEARQAQESIDWFLGPSWPTLYYRQVGILKATTHCCDAPTQERAFGEEDCFDEEKFVVEKLFQ